MRSIQQITIHPREIPPRRKYPEVLPSPQKRPFDPPRRIGYFPAPDPPELIEKNAKLPGQRESAEAREKKAGFIQKKALSLYEKQARKQVGLRPFAGGNDLSPAESDQKQSYAIGRSRANSIYRAAASSDSSSTIELRF